MLLNKSVLLFSGGLDSTCIAALEKPDYLLFIDHNAESQKKDAKNILSFYDKYKSTLFNGSELIINKGMIDLSLYEQENAVIPFRNSFLIHIAANYANSIMLGSVKDDVNKDNGKEFCKKIQSILNLVYPEFEYKVSAKYFNTSKNMLVEKYLAAGFDKQALFDSTSCYKNYENDCGQCKPCLRKKEALEFNGLLL